MSLPPPPEKKTILYIDDEPDNLIIFKSVFRLKYNIITGESAKQGLYLLRQVPIDLIIADHSMPEQTGIDFVAEIDLEFPFINKIILTAYNQSDIILKAVNKAHVYCFATKPWKKEELELMIDNAIAHSQLRAENKNMVLHLTHVNDQLQLANAEIGKLKDQLAAENSYLRKEVAKESEQQMLGHSAAFRALQNKTAQVSGLDTTVLILGETGTGKELVARAIHASSNRVDKPFIKLNCASIPGALVESELFGYEKGSFTGAQQAKPGLFEIADGGTIFLDEIGELPLETQPKLLRVLQEGEFFKIGSTKSTVVSVRIIAATNRSLEESIKKGQFRADLFYRLNVYPIIVPALRERIEDLEPLASYFIQKYRKKLGVTITSVSDYFFDDLKKRTWPGNIRELEATIERSLILCRDQMLTLDREQVSETPHRKEPLMSLEEMEIQHIKKALAASDGKISGKGGAAEMLRVNDNTLRSKMLKFGIHPPR